MRSHMGSAIVALLAATVVSGAPATARTTKAQTTKTFSDRDAAKLKAAAEAAEKGECAKAAPLATELVDRRGADRLPDDLRMAGHAIAAGCGLLIGREDDAYRHALAATGFAQAPDEIWRLRLLIELRRPKAPGDAVATVERLSNGRGAALNGVPVAWLYEFDGNLKKDGANDLRRRLLAVLGGDAYAPDEPGMIVDGFRHRRAELLHKDGDLAGAGALVRRIERPGSLLEISLDPRFRAMLPADFDLRARVEQALAGARTDSARHPDLLSPTLEVASYLRALGRPQEAIDALEALRPRIGDPAAFTDRAERLIWWWDGLSRAHAMLGRYSEAVDALRKGGAAQENGGLNVSQVINLSALQLKLGRPAETLGTLAAFDGGKRDLSPYGTMQIRLNRGCAKAALGKPGDAAADLAFARAHVGDAPDALLDLLLCVGDLDGATTALVAQLDDPERRAIALRNLSDYDDPPVVFPPDPTDAALRQVKARPAVRAAIARAGGTRRFHVQNVSF